MAVYAFSDLHGNYKLWTCIKNYLQENDIAYCLGDCCDRGPDGIKIMREVLRDKRIKYLKGNHEAMFVDAKDKTSKNMDAIDKQILRDNGTLETLRQYRQLHPKQQEKLIKRLERLPIKDIYINKDNKKIFLSHAGCNPSNIFNREEKDFIWDRKHLSLDYWAWDSDLYIVHGHTPIQTLQKPTKENPNANQVLFYCDGHKIDIDVGSFISNMIALINLDTFEVLYFFS